MLEAVVVVEEEDSVEVFDSKVVVVVVSGSTRHGELVEQKTWPSWKQRKPFLKIHKKNFSLPFPSSTQKKRGFMWE